MIGHGRDSRGKTVALGARVDLLSCAVALTNTLSCLGQDLTGLRGSLHHNLYAVRPSAYGRRLEFDTSLILDSAISCRLRIAVTNASDAG
jgi:hypothetical protein